MTKFLHDEKKVFVKIVDVSIKNNFYLFQAVENKYSADKYLVIFSNNQNKYHSQKN